MNQTLLALANHDKDVVAVSLPAAFSGAHVTVLSGENHNSLRLWEPSDYKPHNSMQGILKVPDNLRKGHQIVVMAAKNDKRLVEYGTFKEIDEEHYLVIDVQASARTSV